MLGMSINFKEWNIGAKIIFFSAGVAFLSLFMIWADVGIARASGFDSQGYLFLVLYIYPVIKVLKNKEMKKVIALISSALAVISSIAYISSNTIEIMGSTGNISGSGAYLFLLASIALLFGVIKY